MNAPWIDASNAPIFGRLRWVKKVAEQGKITYKEPSNEKANKSPRSGHTGKGYSPARYNHRDVDREPKFDKKEG